MARPTPPKRKTNNPNIVTRIEWRPYAIEGIDVQLFRAVHFNADNAEIKPAAVPAIDPSYVFREELVREFAWATFPHDNDDPTKADNWTPMLLSGPRGSGKTSFIVQMAALCNVPLFRANLNVGTTVRHLKGRVGAQEGRTVYVAGVVTMAMEAKVGWLLLDEISGVTPPVALSLFPVLEPQGAVLLEDAQPPRYAKRSPFFRVFMTDNALGADMEDARFDYSGTNADMNIALLDRIGAMAHVDYLAPELEHKAVAAVVPSIDTDDLEGMVRVAGMVRRSNEVSGGFSTRMLQGWARRVAAGQMTAKGKRVDHATEKYILDCAQGAFLRKMTSKVERDSVIEIIIRIFAECGVE